MKFASVPAYSFGSKTTCEPITTNKLAPGPGEYDLRNENIIVPSTLFSQAPRPDLFKDSDMPAPNHYFHEKLSKSKSEKNVKAPHNKEKDDKDKNKNRIVPPGPGSYNPQKSTSAISYSMGNKVFAIESKKPKALGPGQYNPNFESIHTSRTAQFGKTARSFKYDTCTPGPGAYEMPKSSAVTTRFGQSERNKLKDDGFPGPGNYEIPRNLGGTYKSLTSRRDPIVSKDLIPGPGAYDIKHVYSTPAFALGSGARSNFIKPGDNPGPGAYNPTLSKLPKGKSIRNGLRPNIVSGNNNPGPGEYKSSNIEIGDGLKLSMQGRKLDAKFNDNPGPGQYNPSINYVRSDPVSVNIGTGLRNSELRSQRNRVPGPGEYNSVKRDNAPTWSFPRDPRSKIVEDDEPGPGYYDIVPSIPDVPKYLMLHINKMDRID